MKKFIGFIFVIIKIIKKKRHNFCHPSTQATIKCIPNVCIEDTSLTKNQYPIR